MPMSVGKLTLGTVGLHEWKVANLRSNASNFSAFVSQIESGLRLYVH
jgi:hypothetical protein